MSFVGDDTYEYAVIINQVMPDLKVDKHKAFGLAHEPVEYLPVSPLFQQYVHNNLKYYLIGKNTNLPQTFVSYYGYLFCQKSYSDTLSFENKPKLMSIIVSYKKFLPGHIYRHQLCSKIVELDLPIDIFGSGADAYNTIRSKGGFTDVHIPYHEYKYTIAIENSTSRDYITEKYTNPVYDNTIPIYFGASNVSEYFGNDWGISLFGDVDKDIQILKNIIANPNKFRVNLTKSLYELEHGKANIKSLFFT